MIRSAFLRYIEAIVGCAIAAAGAFFGFFSTRLPASPDPTAPGPAIAPGSLGLLMLVLGVMIAVSSYRTAASSAPAMAEARVPIGKRKVEIALVMIVACALLFESMGFVLSTVLFLSAGFIFLGEVTWRISVPAAAVASVTLWLFFTKLLGVGLPYGLIAEVLFR